MVKLIQPSSFLRFLAAFAKTALVLVACGMWHVLRGKHQTADHAAARKTHCDTGFHSADGVNRIRDHVYDDSVFPVDRPHRHARSATRILGCGEDGDHALHRRGTRRAQRQPPHPLAVQSDTPPLEPVFHKDARLAVALFFED